MTCQVSAGTNIISEMQTFLANLAQALATACPFLVVNSTNGAYYKNSDQDLIPEFDEDATNLPAYGCHTGRLAPKRVAVLNGGTIQTLDVPYLSGQRDALMKFAVAAMADTFVTSALPNAAIQHKAFARQAFDNDLNILSVYGTEDTRFISTGRMGTFRPQVVGQIIHWPQSPITCCRSVYDHTWPIIMPAGRFLEVLAFRYEASFVVSELRFQLQNNVLFFDFLFDIQFANRTIIFTFGSIDARRRFLILGTGT